MKFVRSLALFASILLLSAINVSAQTPLKAWSASGTTVSNGVDTVQSLIASAYSGDPQGETQIGAFVGLYRGPAYATYIQTKTDNATALLQFYFSTNSYALAPTNATFTTNAYVAAGATNIPFIQTLTNVSLGSNAVAVIRHKSTDTYERNKIYQCQGTNVIFQYPLVTTTSAGDIVYIMAPGAAFNAGTNTTVGQFNTWGPVAPPPGIVSGVTPGAPFLMEITGGTKISLNTLNASGGYLP
jgi:hypothetical protein